MTVISFLLFVASLFQLFVHAIYCLFTPRDEALTFADYASILFYVGALCVAGRVLGIA